MNLGKISIRYARALYALAKEQNIQHTVFEELHLLAKSFFHFPKLHDALSNPMHTAADKEKLLITAAGGEQISPLLKQFFQFIIRKGREEFVLFMAMSYQDIYRKDENIVLGTITSAIPMEKEAVEKIKHEVLEKYSRKLSVHTELDESLIGGFVIQINNFKLDASVKNQLQEIAKEMLLN
jgi:F-type H+-transporting ATPase subunit delta